MRTKALKDVELTVFSICYLGFSKEVFDSPKMGKTKIKLRLYNFVLIPKYLNFSKKYNMLYNIA